YDEAARTGKEVELETSGGEAPLDKSLLELANEALGHLIRNAVVHGLELPNMREAAGKPRNGVVRVIASTRGDEVSIEVSDDGAGIDPIVLKQKAEERGIDTSAIEDPYSILFFPGFSTQDEADLSSGRGVGLSAVLEAVQEKGGTIEVTSELGQGTTFRLRLPLSISIARTLLLAADGEEYALPLPAVVDSLRFHITDRHEMNHAGVIRWRDKLISLLDLGHNFGTARELRTEGYVIVIEAAGKHRGLLADEIKGIREVVVKGLDPIVGSPPGIAGSTVLGDGRPILILDPRSLVEIEPFVRKHA
ncbi:MAG: chemotaxis protein CheW, partial [Acidobacteria bacterium]|nr:chemotaxis protein CheW [Acidobacteriota bacterium]